MPVKFCNLLGCIHKCTKKKKRDALHSLFVRNWSIVQTSYQHYIRKRTFRSTGSLEQNVCTIGATS